MKSNMLFLALFVTWTVHADGFFHSLNSFVKEYRVASAIIGAGIVSQAALFGMAHYGPNEAEFEDEFGFKEKNIWTEIRAVGVVDFRFLRTGYYSVPTFLILFGILNRAEKGSVLKPFFLKS